MRLSLSLVASVAVAITAGMLAPAIQADPLTPTTRQCVWNKGGYVLNVRWFKAEDIRLAYVKDGDWIYCIHQGETSSCPDPMPRNSVAGKLYVEDGKIKLEGGRPARDANGRLDVEEMKARLVVYGDPVQTNVFPVGQGRCIVNRDGQKYTAVIGAQGRKGSTEALRVFLGAVFVIAVAEGEERLCGDVGCVFDGPTDYARLFAEFQKLIPHAKDVFFVGIPGTEKWLDTWGTVYVPAVGEGGDIAPYYGDSTNCHYWTDDFDGWCEQEVEGGWGVREKYRSDCPAGQGRAVCAENWSGGIELAADEEMTDCHLWTDDFDGWCRAEVGENYKMRSRDQHGCLSGQGKAVCEPK